LVSSLSLKPLSVPESCFQQNPLGLEIIEFLRRAV
jgi:hypothetical protein